MTTTSLERITTPFSLMEKLIQILHEETGIYFQLPWTSRQLERFLEERGKVLAETFQEEGLITLCNETPKYFVSISHVGGTQRFSLCLKRLRTLPLVVSFD